MKKYMYKYAWLIGVFVLVSGCDDFLEVEPKGSSTEANFFNDPNNAIKAVNAIYDPLTWGQSGNTLPVNFSHSYEFIVGDILTDDAVKGSTDSDLPVFQNWRSGELLRLMPISLRYGTIHGWVYTGPILR